MHSNSMPFVLILLLCSFQINIVLGQWTDRIAASVIFEVEALKDQTYCRFTECCNGQYIPANVEAFSQDLRQNLYGQHIVQDNLVPVLAAHFQKQYRVSQKPLVISFHGVSGTGKNFVAKKIVNSLYKKGPKSKFVRNYMGRSDFPLDAEAMNYSAKLVKEIREAIAACPRSLFIFDEVNKMPKGIFESLTSLLRSSTIDSYDNTQSVFIFLSNTGGDEISEKLSQLYKEGVKREDTKLSDFEHILENISHNLEGGFEDTNLIKSNVIDYFIPFLPLEKSHVSQCVRAEFMHWSYVPMEQEIEQIIADTVVYKHDIFVKSGCKRLDKKVSTAVTIARQK